MYGKQAESSLLFCAIYNSWVLGSPLPWLLETDDRTTFRVRLRLHIGIQGKWLFTSSLNSRKITEVCFVFMMININNNIQRYPDSEKNPRNQIEYEFRFRKSTQRCCNIKKLFAPACSTSSTLVYCSHFKSMNEFKQNFSTGRSF